MEPGANLVIALRAGAQLDYAVSQLASEWVDALDANASQLLSGPNGDRRYIKWRASFGTANGTTQPPSLETIILPYRREP